MRLSLLIVIVTLFILAPIQSGLAQTADDPSRSMYPSELDTISDEERRAFERELPRLKDIQARWEDRIFSIPGVVSMGISWGDGRSFFFVTTDNGYTGDKIPVEIEGVAVRVQQRGPFRLLHGMPSCTPPCHADLTPAPVEMGNSARWFQQNGGCTAGFKACDLGTGRLVVITNSHCAQFSNGCALAPLGQSVLAPASGDAPAGVSRIIGTISGHAAPSCEVGAVNFVDATKFDSSPQQTSIVHRDIGEQKISVHLASPGEPMMPTEFVQSSGRTSGFKIGPITAINVTVQVPAQAGFCCGALRMYDQIVFDPVNRSQPGDSGSGVLTFDLHPGVWPNRVRRVAGLLFGVDNIGSYFNKIGRLEEALNITTDLSQCEQ